MKICILGAGISGVALARMLARDGHDVVVLEKSSRAGGLCKSREVGGFTFDEAGGHILYSKREEILDWQIERVGGPGAVVTKERRTKIRWHDRWVPYPFENGVGHLSQEAIVDCMEGYLEAHVARRLGKPCPENFKDWIEWRMGSGFAHHFMLPYNEKVWKCDLTEMASSWVAGRVPEAPIKDILRAAVGIKTEGYTHQSVFYFPKHGGFEAMVRGALDGGGFDLRVNQEIEQVRRAGEAYIVNGEDYDLVVNTAPLPAVEPAFEDIPRDIRSEIQQLQPISLINVMIGVELDAPLPDLSWVYLPFPEQGPTNRVTFFSNYSPNNAPEGHGSFMAEATYRGEFQPDQEWIDGLVRGLEEASILKQGQVMLTDWANSKYAYIDQDLAFADRIERVREWFDGSGYVTFGRFGRYEYHNSDQCIARAMEVHKHIREIAATGTPAQPVFS
ncbi:MAG: protoporphyrinogen/coproporphyrinogen oxidase [Planctomycetota bacterium]